MIQCMRYPGGKGKCFQRLINLMPPHRVYIESHLGGGAVMLNKRPAERSIGIDPDDRVIRQWQAIQPAPCQLVQGRAEDYLAGYGFRGDELIYVDPPYVPETRRRRRVYRHDYSIEDHERLLEVLCALPCKVLVSGYDNALYGQRLRGWRRVSFPAKTHTDVRQECVWMNYDAAAQLHDASHLGDNFRARQSIKRRLERFVQRFESMDPAERSELLRQLHVKFGVSESRP
jgi:site-specific DNA-adenine methylase